MFHLPPDERDLIRSELTAEQLAYLAETMARGKRTAFARVMAEAKGADISNDASYEEIEAHLSEWVLDQYIDAGHVSSEHRCECGRSLRHQYIVIQKSTGEIRSFGITHLQEHTGFDATIVSLIKKGFEAIDYELDQVLSKVRDGWKYDREFLNLPPELEVPSDIKRHMAVGLPLHDGFIRRLKALKRDYEQDMVQKRREEQARQREKAAGMELMNKFHRMVEQLEQYKSSPRRELYPGLEINLARCDELIRRIEDGDVDTKDCLDRLSSLLMSLSYSPLGR
ncbi:hypothetical protein [Gorillibacterium massiliense]|uniref:hypothetical protein n=1 Tax=Gorillibacterium massiliense TaxID=1280390 RepID=UPI0004AC7633|nr:hypothetical protein [Gorillibacterium massiliense]